MLELRDLGFTYGRDSAPYCFSLDVAPGQIAVVTGPSGAGKSTLLDLIAGFLTPSSGSLVLDGADLIPLPPESRPVSILFQSGNLFDHLTAAANLALGLPDRTPRHIARERIGTALDNVGLSGFGGRLAARLSGGQLRRVALARTLLRNRPVLLLDEPFAGLDAKTASQMRTLVLDLTKRQGWHTILVSHSPQDTEIPGARVWEIDTNTLHEI